MDENGPVPATMSEIIQNGLRDGVIAWRNFYSIPEYCRGRDRRWREETAMLSSYSIDSGMSVGGAIYITFNADIRTSWMYTVEFKLGYSEGYMERYQDDGSSWAYDTYRLIREKVPEVMDLLYSDNPFEHDAVDGVRVLDRHSWATNTYVSVGTEPTQPLSAADFDGLANLMTTLNESDTVRWHSVMHPRMYDELWGQLNEYFPAWNHGANTVYYRERQRHASFEPFEAFQLQTQTIDYDGALPDTLVWEWEKAKRGPKVVHVEEESW